MRTTDFVHSYFDAWNHHDPDGVVQHFAQNGCYYDIPEHTRRTHDELAGWLAEYFARNRQRYELHGEVTQGESTIAFQYRIIPDGKESRQVYQGAEFVTLCDDGALMIADYYDVPGAVDRSQVPSTNDGSGRPKYAKSGLDDAQLARYKARLEDVMRSQKLFLQSDLTLPRLAEAVNCSVNHLSQVINAGFGVSFFDYLNLYRIEHARELLGRPDGEDHAILNIAYSVGFNSNSAFYAAFRKHVGQTPARYRRERLASAK